MPEMTLPDDAEPVDMVLDTDTCNEMDDQFAVLWSLLNGERLNVRALTALVPERPFQWRTGN